MPKELFLVSTNFTVAIFKIPQISKHFSAVLTPTKAVGKNYISTGVSNNLVDRFLSDIYLIDTHSANNNINVTIGDNSNYRIPKT